MSDQAPIIVIKKKVFHGGHHGGAWKVAYADFVTAMMALFIVLWLLSSSEDVKKAVGGYFQDPKGQGKQIGSTLAGSGESLSLSKMDMKQIKQKIEEAMKKAPEFQSIREHISITVTGEGLRIELLETDKGMFFTSGSSVPSKFGAEILASFAAELGKMPNGVLIEGHTDSIPFTSDREYSNWELSSDRANAARRLMQENGLRDNQVTQVRGFADQRLRKAEDPKDPTNRRISVIVQYLIPGLADPKIPVAKSPVNGEKDAKPSPGGEKAEHGKEAPTEPHKVARKE